MKTKSGTILWWLLIAGTLCLGCRSWNWLGKGFDDDLTSAGSRLRSSAADDDQRPLGLSAKSREIERNLGVR